MTRWRRYAAACLSLCVAAACGDSGTVPVSISVGPPAGQLLIDFASRAPDGAFQPAEPLYDFSQPESEWFLLDGWSAPESADGRRWFAWAVSRESHLRLRVLDDGPHWLHLRARPFMDDAATVQTVAMQVNEMPVGTLELPPGDFQTYSVPLPGDAVAMGDNVLSFSFAYTASPAQDSRNLAVAFDYVAVTRHPEPPVTTARTVRAETYDVIDDTLRLPGGSELVWPVTIPDSAVMEFGVTVRAASQDSDLRAEVVLRPVPQTGNEDEVFFSEPGGREAATWRADLSAWAGDNVELVLRAVGGAASDNLDWVQPRLYGDVGGMNVTTNVVLIVIDTLRADALGVYGGEADTPNIDALAESGVLFERAYSHIPITLPSHSSMFTSLIPTEHAAFVNGAVLGEDQVTLAELMRRAYRGTAGFVSLGVLKHEFGIAQGFADYHDDFGWNWWKTAGEINAMVLPWLERRQARPFFLWVHYSDPHEPYAAPDGMYPDLTVQSGGLADISLTADGNTTPITGDWPPGATEVTVSSPTGHHALRINNLRVTGRHLSVTCGHGCAEERPNPSAISYVTDLPATLTVDNPTDETVSASLVFRISERLSPSDLHRRYLEEVEYADREIGRLLAVLDRVANQDTLIVLTADHGEELGVHGPPGHVSQLYDAVLRVPLILRWPERLPEGITVAEPVAHIDLLPTVMELLEIDDPSPRSGRSLLPLLKGGASGADARTIVAETFRPEAPKDRQAVIAGQFKLILTPEDDVTELYDLENDPEERRNLADDETETATRLREMLMARLAAAQAGAPAPEESTLTDEQLERLRSLGYVR